METYPWKRRQLLGKFEVLVRLAWSEEEEKTRAWENARGDGERVESCVSETGGGIGPEET